MVEDKYAWERAFERALKTTVRFRSRHAPLEAPPGLPAPDPPQGPISEKPPARDWTLFELFAELIQPGWVSSVKPAEGLLALARSAPAEAGEWLLNSILRAIARGDVGQRIADIRVDEAAKLNVLGLDGKPIDPAGRWCRKATVVRDYLFPRQPQIAKYFNRTSQQASVTGAIHSPLVVSVTPVLPLLTVTRASSVHPVPSPRISRQYSVVHDNTHRPYEHTS